jgi:DNA polymerase epsilon subunit 1
MLKKRYVVFNFNNKIKEFKGFEMKRRGELRITKVFQEEIFPQYLKGASLEECYAHCASVAKKYLAIIQRNGQAMDTN